MSDLRSYLYAEAERSLQTLLDNHVIPATTWAAAVSILKHERDGTPVEQPPMGAPPEPLGGTDPALKAHLLKQTQQSLRALDQNHFLSHKGHVSINQLLKQQQEKKGIPQHPPPGYIPPASAYSPSTQPQVFQGYAYPAAPPVTGYPQPAYGQQGPQGQYVQQGQPAYAQQGQPAYAQQGQPAYAQPYPNVQQEQQAHGGRGRGQQGRQQNAQPQAAEHSQWGQFAAHMGNNIANGMSSGFGRRLGGDVANEVFHDTMHMFKK